MMFHLVVFPKHINSRNKGKINQNVDPSHRHYKSQTKARLNEAIMPQVDIGSWRSGRCEHVGEDPGEIFVKNETKLGLTEL